MTIESTPLRRLPLLPARHPLAARAEAVAMFLMLALMALTAGAAWHEIGEAAEEENDSEPTPSISF